MHYFLFENSQFTWVIKRDPEKYSPVFFLQTFLHEQ